MDNITGLIFNKNNETIDTGLPQRINDLDEIPSPYLNGTFDKLVKNNPEVTWNTIIETNRGCPYQCTFCDWGSLTYNKIKKFNLDRVLAEIEWISKIKSEFVSIADANFGIFIDRDNLIVDKLIDCKKIYGFPKYYGITWAKNQKTEVVNIVKKITDKEVINNGVNISVQTLTETVLNIIKRTNLEAKQINQMFQDCEKANVPVYTELILGLPGETLETWKTNYWKLFDLGNHTGISVYQAQLLENAEMNLVQKKIYKMKSKPVYDYLTVDDEIDYLPESVYIVVSTKDIPYNKMLDAHVFNWFITTFHLNGLTSYISRFCNKFYKIDYENFYEQLYIFLKKKCWFNKQEEEIRQYFDQWMLEGTIGSVYIDNKVKIVSKNLHNLSTMYMHYYNTYDIVFETIKEFVYNLQLDNHLMDEVLYLQKKYIIDAHNLNTYPKQINFNIDLLGYLQTNANLFNPSTVEFQYPGDRNITLQRFVENIYFARRRNFGKANIVKTA